MSPRNRAVAVKLNEAGLATILADLLTEPEAADRARVKASRPRSEHLGGAFPRHGRGDGRRRVGTGEDVPSARCEHSASHRPILPRRETVGIGV